MTNKQLDTIEKLMLDGDYEEAAKQLKEKGMKALSEYAAQFSSSVSYVSDKEELKMLLDFLKLYRKSKIPKKPSQTTPFFSLQEAMKHIKIFGYSAKNELMEKEKEREREKRLTEKEKNLLKPQTQFRPLPITQRIGVAHSDIVIVGDSKAIQQALKQYDFACDFFSVNQLIIRKVTLLGIRKSSYFVPGKPLKGPKRITERKFLLNDIIKLVSRIDEFGDNQIVISQTCAYRDHFYFLLLPRTVVSKPYCKERMGKLIPIISEWGILVV